MSFPEQNVNEYSIASKSFVSFAYASKALFINNMNGTCISKIRKFYFSDCAVSINFILSLV